MSIVRIGAGAGFQGDRIEPAVDLAERGSLDFLVFECLAERTIADDLLRQGTGGNEQPHWVCTAFERHLIGLKAFHRD